MPNINDDFSILWQLRTAINANKTDMFGFVEGEKAIILIYC